MQAVLEALQKNRNWHAIGQLEAKWNMKGELESCPHHSISLFFVLFLVNKVCQVENKNVCMTFILHLRDFFFLSWIRRMENFVNVSQGYKNIIFFP